ncbi:Uncharacterized protein C1orf112 [Anthophora retusa]
MASETSFNSLLEDSFSESDKKRYDVELLQQALQQCLSSCPDSFLDKKLFNETLPFAHRLLTEALKQIDETIHADVKEDTVKDTKRQLLVCHELLSVWERSVERVSKLHKTSAINLKCILENALLAIKLIFEHCRASKKLYGTLFEDVSEELTNLFRKTKTILSLFLATLDGVIVFDTDTESEMELLVKGFILSNRGEKDKKILPFIIELLFKMHRCSPLCLQKSQFDDKLIELINVHISKGTEPFLNTVFKITDFKQAFFEYGNQTNIDNLGYYLLTISIMKKLISMPYEQHCNWTLGAESIIDIALTNINYIQEEICVGEVRLPGVHDIGEKARSATLYEATLVSICSLISHIPTDGFHAVELILLKHLLSNRLWSSLLSSDIWCFIGRIGSSELCASHVKYLLHVYTALTKRSNSLEIVILENLIGRLYSLLSEETRHSLMIEFDDFENLSWKPVARFLPTKTKLFLQNRLACVLNDIPNMFAELQRQPTVQNWNRIAILMSIVGKLNYTLEKNIIDIVSQMWNCVANTIEIFEGRQLDILSEFMSKLFAATQPEKIQDDTFFSILEAILTSFLCFPLHVKVTASHYLRNNIDSFGSCGIKAANALAELNSQLLEDENPWLRQEALESFDHVAHMCPNEDLVTTMAAAITKKSLLSDSLSSYLSGTVFYELQDFSDVRIYLQHVAKYCENVCHVCNNYEDSQRDEKLAKLEAQSSESLNESTPLNDFDEHVSKVCDELNDILKKSRDIESRVLRRLRSVCAKILDLTETK